MTIKRGRTANWVITLLILVVFFLVQHRSVPNLTLPKNASVHGQAVRIPVAVRTAPAHGAFWNLSRTTDAKRYFVTAYESGNPVRQFATQGAPRSAADGVDYPASGQVRFRQALYRAVTIHVNRDGRSGYILFVPATAADSGHTPAGNTAGNKTDAADSTAGNPAGGTAGTSPGQPR
ncbi:MAG: hypothetical protein K6T30_02520 [Alicyclobacillus sp.]|nr:hypothetical protein [Alicyclobacillus sp.]